MELYVSKESERFLEFLCWVLHGLVNVWCFKQSIKLASSVLYFHWGQQLTKLSRQHFGNEGSSNICWYEVNLVWIFFLKWLRPELPNLQFLIYITDKSGCFRLYSIPFRKYSSNFLGGIYICSFQISRWNISVFKKNQWNSSFNLFKAALFNCFFIQPFYFLSQQISPASWNISETITMLYFLQ